MEPTFLEKCIDQLNERQDCDLAFSKYRLIDAQGKELAPEARALPQDHRLTSSCPKERFEDSMIDMTGSRHIFGVFRAEALRQTPLIKSFAGSDLGLLIRMMLKAPLAEVGECLFNSRRDDHCATIQFGADKTAWNNWFDPKNADRKSYPILQFWLMNVVSIMEAPLSLEERTACFYKMWERTMQDPHASVLIGEQFMLMAQDNTDILKDKLK